MYRRPSFGTDGWLENQKTFDDSEGEWSWHVPMRPEAKESQRIFPEVHLDQVRMNSIVAHTFTQTWKSLTPSQSWTKLVGGKRGKKM